MKINRTLAGIVLGSALTLATGCGSAGQKDESYKGEYNGYKIEAHTQGWRSNRYVSAIDKKTGTRLASGFDETNDGRIDVIKVSVPRGSPLESEARKVASLEFLENAYESVKAQKQ